MFSYRNLQIEDLDVICTFPQSSDELFYMSPKSHYPLTPSQLQTILLDRLEPTVIVEQATKQVVAYANIYNYDALQKTAWLGNVIVSPHYRGKGAAMYLIQAMQKICREKLNVERLCLACHSTNTRGLVFYSKCGYKPFDINTTKIDSNNLVTIHLCKIIE